MSSVDHPSHYNINGRKECIVEMLEKFGEDAVRAFCVLNAYKYRYRHELKGGAEDLQKAEWYDNFASKLTTRSLPDRMQNALRHIETAVDVDEWAVEVVREGFEKLSDVYDVIKGYDIKYHRDRGDLSDMELDIMDVLGLTGEDHE